MKGLRDLQDLTIHEMCWIRRQIVRWVSNTCVGVESENRSSRSSTKDTRCTTYKRKTRWWAGRWGVSLAPRGTRIPNHESRIPSHETLNPGSCMPIRVETPGGGRGGGGVSLAARARPRGFLLRYQGPPSFGLVFKAHILLYHSTLVLRVIKKKRRRMEDLLRRALDHEASYYATKVFHPANCRPILPTAARPLMA